LHVDIAFFFNQYPKIIHTMTKRVVASQQQLKEKQKRLLRALLTVKPDEGFHVARATQLADIDAFSDFGSARTTRVKNLRTTTRELTGKVAGVLHDVESSDRQLMRALGSNARALAHHGMPPIEEVRRERVRLFDELRFLGTRIETDLETRVQSVINGVFFKGAGVCSPEFAVRLVRLDFYRDAGNVFNPQVPTPATLEEVKAQLVDFSQRKHPPGKDRPIEDLSTKELQKGAPGFYYLVERKLRETRSGGKGSVTDEEVSRIVKTVLTGEEGVSYKKNPRDRRYRLHLYSQLLARADDDKTAIRARWLTRGIQDYYREQSGKAGSPFSQTDALIAMVREFDDLPSWQECMVRARGGNRNAQKQVVLRFFEPIATYTDYGSLMGLGVRAVGDAIRELSPELTLLIKAGRSPRQIADQYNVGARGIQALIEMYGGGLTDRNGNLRITSSGGRKKQPTQLQHRRDMYSIEDLAEQLVEHLRAIRGVGEAGQLPPGTVRKPRSLRPLSLHSRVCTEACWRRDFFIIADTAEKVASDANEAKGLPEKDRTITVEQKGEKVSTRVLGDTYLDKLAALAGEIQEESRFKD